MKTENEHKETPGASVVDSSALFSELVHFKQRAFAAEKLCIETHECFDAAEYEGIIEAIDEGDNERIRDVWTRRMTNIRGALARFHDEYEYSENDEMMDASRKEETL